MEPSNLMGLSFLLISESLLARYHGVSGDGNLISDERGRRTVRAIVELRPSFDGHQGSLPGQ